MVVPELGAALFVRRISGAQYRGLARRTFEQSRCEKFSKNLDPFSVVGVSFGCSSGDFLCWCFWWSWSYQVPLVLVIYWAPLVLVTPGTNSGRKYNQPSHVHYAQSDTKYCWVFCGTLLDCLEDKRPSCYCIENRLLKTLQTRSSPSLPQNHETS